MKLDGIHTRSIMRTEDGAGARILDQRDLPWKVTWVELRDAATAERAIREMWTRGAPLIGATAAYGLALALAEDASDAGLAAAHALLLDARPTAVQSALGARRCGRACPPAPPWRPGRRRLRARRRDRR